MPAEVTKEIELEIAHVLFIDIVGYSKLLMDEQRDCLQQLNRIVRASEVFRKAEKAGRLLKIATGDGMALVFYKSPEEPAHCAVEISRALKEHPGLQIRMGVHSGPVSGVVDVNEQTNIAGAGINIAQRVMYCGDAGHILLSHHVAEDLEEYERWQPLVHDLGQCEVKHGARIGIANLYDSEVGNPELPAKLLASKKHRAHVRWAEAILALLVLGAIVAAAFIFVSRQPARQASSIPEKSIAVLPFQNLSEDKANAYFTDGIQDEILTRLSKIADLKVISRTSTQQYKSAPENLREIARQLGVAHIVEGSVQKNGDAVRINVQLIKAANDSHLYADTFDRKFADIFAIETEVAKAIAEQLRAKLTGKEEQVITAKPTNNPAAYDAYLRGLAYTLKTGLSAADQMAAQAYLKEAVRLDPQFALAWALLSQADAVGYVMLLLQPTSALREEARQAADTALDLQPNLPEALMAKGWYHYGCLKDYDTAARYFAQARQLLPNNSQIPEAQAYVARRRGEWDRSEVYFNEAEQLDPRNISLLTQHAFFYIFVGRFADAARKLDQVIEIAPKDPDTIAEQALVAQAEGDLPRAAKLLAPLQPAADDPFAVEAQVYQAVLEREPARAIPHLVEILSKPDPTLGYLNAELRFWLGWVQELAGQEAAAQTSWQQARMELENFLKQQPDNYVLIGDLALTQLGLGDKTDAFTLAERAMAAIPISKDAMDGSIPIEILARVAAQAGESDRAIAAVEKALSIPGAGAWVLNTPLTPSLLRLDPMFDPLRSDSRFQKLCEEKKP